MSQSILNRLQLALYCSKTMRLYVFCIFEHAYIENTLTLTLNMLFVVAFESRFMSVVVFQFCRAVCIYIYILESFGPEVESYPEGI